MRRERLLNDGYGKLRTEVFASVRGKLASQSMYFDDSELEWFYNQAWQGLNVKLLDGETIANPPGLLVTIMFRRAVDQYRREHVDHRSRHAEVSDQHDDGRDLEQTLDDRTKLRHFAEAISYRLSKQERALASLCYLHDFSRAEAARLLGIPERRVQKVMDGHMGRPGVAKKVAAFVAAIESGRWCAQHESTMKAYAFGLLDVEGDRYRFATGHVADCVSCKRYVASLRGLAGVLPPALLPLGVGGSGTVAALAAKLGLAASEAATAGGGGAVAAGGTAIVGGGAAAGGSITAGASGGLLTLKAALGCAAAVTAGGACVALGTGAVDIKPEKPPAAQVAPNPSAEEVASPPPPAVAAPLPADSGQASEPRASSGSETASEPAPPRNEAEQTQQELGIEQPPQQAARSGSASSGTPTPSSSGSSGTSGSAAGAGEFGIE